MTTNRNIVKIDPQKCNGCGQCVTACAEGAIQIIDGKARLVSENYCDGLGACLGSCPEDAITIEQRPAEPFDERATAEHLQHLHHPKPQAPCLCPSVMAKSITHTAQTTPVTSDHAGAEPVPSQLSNWPVQLQLVPPAAPYLRHADLLLVADCVPFALGDFHNRFLKGRPVVIGCPKLDNPDAHVQKLIAILEQARINSLTVIHMEVPCCSGLTRIAQTALKATQTEIPAHDVTISIEGVIINKRELTYSLINS